MPNNFPCQHTIQRGEAKGQICGIAARSPEGCSKHKKMLDQVKLCKKCLLPTGSRTDICSSCQSMSKKAPCITCEKPTISKTQQCAECQRAAKLASLEAEYEQTQQELANNQNKQERRAAKLREKLEQMRDEPLVEQTIQPITHVMKKRSKASLIKSKISKSTAI